MSDCVEIFRNDCWSGKWIKEFIKSCLNMQKSEILFTIQDEKENIINLDPIQILNNEEDFQILDNIVNSESPIKSIVIKLIYSEENEILKEKALYTNKNGNSYSYTFVFSNDPLAYKDYQSIGHEIWKRPFLREQTAFAYQRGLDWIAEWIKSLTLITLRLPNSGLKQTWKEFKQILGSKIIDTKTSKYNFTDIVAYPSLRHDFMTTMCEMKVFEDDFGTTFVLYTDHDYQWSWKQFLFKTNNDSLYVRLKLSINRIGELKKEQLQEDEFFQNLFKICTNFEYNTNGYYVFDLKFDMKVPEFQQNKNYWIRIVRGNMTDVSPQSIKVNDVFYIVMNFNTSKQKNVKIKIVEIFDDDTYRGINEENNSEVFIKKHSSPTDILLENNIHNVHYYLII